MNPEKLIDRIYEAAVIPDVWPGVLHNLSQMAGCIGGLLFTTSALDQIGRWTGSADVQELMTEFLADPELPATNIRLTRFAAARHHGFLGNDRLYGRDVMDHTVAYSKFLLPKGLGYCAGSAVPLPNGDMAAFSLERRYDSGPVTDEELAMLDIFRPHLGRAAAISTRLNLERARQVVEALGAAGLAAAILAHNGRALAANTNLQGMTGQFIFQAFDRIGLADPAAHALLCEAIERTTITTTSRSVPVPAVAGAPAAVVHLVPLPGDAADIFYNAHALMVVTALDKPAAPTAELLSGLFDLTPAEARVARCISERKTTEETAAALGLSRETVRWYLKSVFAKTGVSRQAELSALLSGAVLKRRDVTPEE